MKKFTFIRLMLTSIMIMFSVTFIGIVSCNKPADSPLQVENSGITLVSPDHITAGWLSNIQHFSSLTRIESDARKSSVRVEKPDGRGYGSGSYGYYDHQLVVFTANHVVDGNSIMFIHGRGGEVVIGVVIYTDKINDFAVLKVNEIESREPIRFRPVDDVVSNYVGWNITYTGFPAGYDLLTITGRIAGIRTDGQAVVAHSFTWMGASGSGVFNSRGEYVGPLVAVGLGRFQVTQVVEDMVWIIPATILDWDAVSASLLIFQ
jgi:S1-C subfamily serine protease